MPSEIYTSQGPFISMFLFYVSWGPEMCSSPIPTDEILTENNLQGQMKWGFCSFVCLVVFFFFPVQ